MELWMYVEQTVRTPGPRVTWIWGSKAIHSFVSRKRTLKSLLVNTGCLCSNWGRFSVMSFVLLQKTNYLSHIFFRGKLCQQHQSRTPWWLATSLVRLLCPPIVSRSTLADPCCWMLLTEPRPHHERQRACPRPSPYRPRSPSHLNDRPCSGSSPGLSPSTGSHGTTCCPRSTCPNILYHPGRCVGTEEAAAVCQKQETGQ